MQTVFLENDIIAAILRMTSVNAYLHEEQISFRSDLKQRTLRLFFEKCSPNKNNKMTLVPDLKVNDYVIM